MNAPKKYYDLGPIITDIDFLSIKCPCRISQEDYQILQNKLKKSSLKWMLPSLEIHSDGYYYLYSSKLGYTGVKNV